MATYKRRVVYLSDKEWSDTSAAARAFAMTTSAYTRALILGSRLDSPGPSVVMPLDGDGVPVGRRKAQRVDDAFNRRPFTPVPKKGK